MSRTKQLVMAALCIALGVALPQAFHAVPNAGSVFLPMHIPVLIGGFLTGPLFGAAIGFFTPLLSHLMFGMPPASVLPGMLCELTAYGLLTGLFNKIIKIKKPTVKVFVVLILAMIGGRITYGILNALIFRAGKYSMQAWISAALVTALPGIIIQLVVVPAVILLLDKREHIL